MYSKLIALFIYRVVLDINDEQNNVKFIEFHGDNIEVAVILLDLR